MKKLIQQLTEEFGPSGYEAPVRDLIKSLIVRHVDEVRVDAMGNLIARKKAVPQNGIASRRIMLAAHMDEIGVMISYIDDKAFLRFTPIGGVFPSTLLGSRVVFTDGSVGVIGREKPDHPDELPSISKMFIDVGAKDREHLTRKVGDPATFTRPFVDIGERLVAKAFDDRIGCAILIQSILNNTVSPHEVYYVFTVQEEVGLRGAVTSAYGVEPDVAIAVDITLTGDTPEAQPMAVALGAGPAIKVKDRGMLAHPAVKDWLVDTAKRLGIPYQLEVLEMGTTDAMAIQTSRAGVAAGVISIATRYAHTPSEMIDFADVQGAVSLIDGLLGAGLPF